MSEQQPDIEESEPSRFVTVYQQLKDRENREEGDRFIIHGRHHGDRHKVDDEKRGFVPVARAIAQIDVGVEIEEDEVTEWSNSYAGRSALQPFFPELPVDDPTLPDVEELLERDRDD